MTPPETETETQLLGEVADVVDQRDIRLVRMPTGGASRAGFRVNDAAGNGIAFVLLQEDPTGVHAADPRMVRETALLTRLHAAGVLVPRVFGHLRSLPGAVLELKPGTTIIEARHRDTVACGFGRLLAGIHGLPVHDMLDDAPDTCSAALEVDLSWWADLAATSGVLGHEIVDVAIGVLNDRLPRLDEAPCLVHGDAGAGNFLVVGDEITALLDWEMAHGGQFHEDLAWMWARSVHSDFGRVDRAFESYAKARGVTIDPGLLEWQLVFVLAKIVIALSAALLDARGSRLALTRYNLLLVYRALLCSSLAQAIGIRYALLTESPEAGRSERSALFERLTHLLADEQQEARWLVEILQKSVEHTDGDPSGASPARLADRVLELCRQADRELHTSRRAVALARRAQHIGLGR